MITLDQVTGKIGELSALPPTATRLAQILASELFSIEECVEIIRYDEALTLEVLKFANSASSGASREITSIRDAVVRLGGGRILKEILAKYLKRSINGALPAYGYQELELWRHSVAAALAAECLGSHIPPSIGGLAFTAALLHDIGKLVLARTAPKEDMEVIWRLVSSSECACVEAEKSVLGFSHAEVGAEVLRAWEMPEAIVVAVRDHHAADVSSGPMTDSVMVANVVARSIGEGIGFEGMNIGADPSVAKRMGLTRELFECVCAQTAHRMREVAASFSARE